MPVTITNAGIGDNARAWLANVVTFCRDLLQARFNGADATVSANLVRNGDATAGVAVAAMAVLDELDLTTETTFGGQDWLTFPFQSSYAVPWASDTHQCLDWFPEAQPTLHEADLYNSFCPSWESRVTGKLTRLRDALSSAGDVDEAAVALSISNALSAAGDQSSLLSPSKSANALLDIAKFAVGAWLALQVLELLLNSRGGGDSGSTGVAA